MIRLFLFTVLAAGVLHHSIAAQVDVAPAPRQIRPDGSRDPVPEPAAARKENPLEVVKRIIANSNAVGDKLAMTDTGTETLGKQEIILKDIKSLIDRQEDPPPPQSDQNQDKNDQKPDDMNQKKDKGDKGDKGDKDMPPMPMGKGKGDKGDKSDMGDMGDEEPMGRRPRRQVAAEPKQSGGQNPSSAKQQSQPMSTPMQPPKNTGGKTPDPKMDDPKRPGIPLLPIEDEIVKEVWGHLPDKMRQQATQYYQQDFMPRYTELLKLYYSSLAEKGGKR